MANTLAFDVYGTLVDPMGIVEAVREHAGKAAPAFAAAWRDKQLEYLFRRGLGRKYEPFSVCTRQALDFVCLRDALPLTDAARDSLIARYAELPAFPEASAALDALRAAGHGCFAFSNGEPGDLDTLLVNASLRDKLDGVISVHEIRSYKPDPLVYGHFLEKTGALPGRTWLVSGNPFDVIGALEVGWKAAWVRRNPAQKFDPWDVDPTVTVPTLDELAQILS